jgi:hypothetical protein
MKVLKKDRLQPRIKQFDLKAFGADITPDMIDKINRFSLKPLTAEEVYVRKYLYAHNAVDRDNERFPEKVLDDFAATLPGKSLLKVHDRKSLPVGLFFDASTEDMTKDQFKVLTGEDARIPEGMNMVKVAWGWIYMLKSPFNEEIMANIDAGVYRHHSPGFRCADIMPVKGPYEQVLYWEYVPPGEAVEGSIVWLGAQIGSTVQKAAGDSESEEGHDIDEKTEGGKKVDKLLKKLMRLFPGKSFTEDGLFDEIKEVFEEMKQHARQALDEVKAALAAKTQELETAQAKVTELTPLAADGKAFRDGLISDYVAAKAKLGEVTETPEAQDAVKQVASGYPIEFLKSEVKHLQTRVEEKFPAEPQLKGDMRKDKSADKGNPSGEKDNELVPDED